MREIWFTIKFYICEYFTGHNWQHGVCLNCKVIAKQVRK